MSTSSFDSGLAPGLAVAKEDQPQSQTAAAEGPSVLSIFGSWTFVASLAAGLAAGLALLPYTREQFIGAAISFGALCIAAAATYRALRARKEVEDLQQRLLDEASYHAFVDGALE